MSLELIVATRDLKRYATRHPIARLLVLGLLVQSGCQEKVDRAALSTYPVSGKVVTNGKLPVGGCVQFEPTQNGMDYVAQGVIDKEGRFSLRVPYVDRVLPGATEGPHNVRVLLPINQGGGMVPITEPLIVEPGANEFTINMPTAPSQ
jgi:hypothetical protein